MFKNRVVFGVLAMAMIIFLAVVSVYAEGMKGNYAQGKGMDHKFFSAAKLVLNHTEHLNLSEDQINKIKALKLDAKKEVIRKDAEIEILALDIKVEMGKDMIDVKALNKLIDKKYDLKKEKTKVLAAAYANLFNGLTSEQKALFKGLTDDCKKNCAMMQGGGHGQSMGMGMGKGKCPMKK